MKHPVHAPLAALLLALAGCGGSGSSDAVDPPPEGRAVALSASRPGQLASYVQQRLTVLEDQGRLAGGGYLDGTPSFGAIPVAATSAAPQASRTLVQESGVDEPDLIQTDGSTIYTLQPAASGSSSLLHVYARGSDGRAARLATVPLASDAATSSSPQGMVFNGAENALAVVSHRWTQGDPADFCPNCITPAGLTMPGWMRSSVMVQRVDVSSPGSAQAGTRVDIDGHLVDSRRIGDRLYVVTRHQPTLPVALLPSSASSAQRRAAIAAITAADLLPKKRINGAASQPLMADTDCYVQAGNGSSTVQLTTVTVFDLTSSSLAHTSRCFVGGSEALYMTPSSLYIATTRWDWVGGDVRVTAPTDIRTDIHKFALTGGTVSYRASGDVPGHLGWNREFNSYRLSEHNGDLRVLTFTGSTGWWGTQEAATTTAPPSPATLSVLRESGGALQTVATLPNSQRPAAIGKPGEQVYAVRFVGDRGYVVTFRRTDPLYVLDLSNPADPKAVGELEIAGFSDQLVPLPGGLLLGVGKDADAQGRALGIKVALFDVSNPAQPSERGTLLLGSTGSSSALDYSRHGLNLMMRGDTARLALPVLLTSSPYTGWQRGLQRMEVDTAARTLVAKPLIAAAGDPSTFSALWLERAAQVGDQLYHLSGGNLATYDW